MDKQDMIRDELMESGFSAELVDYLYRIGPMPERLTESHRRNIALLNRYAKKETLVPAEVIGLYMFLKTDNEENEAVMELPEKYGFSETEKNVFLHSMLTWKTREDLRPQMDEALQAVFPDETERMSIYRSMYLDGGVWICEDMLEKLREIRSIAPDEEAFAAVIRENWRLLLVMDNRTADFVIELKKCFMPEKVWEIFCSELRCVTDFCMYSPRRDRSREIMERLCTGYNRYLK